VEAVEPFRRRENSVGKEKQVRIVAQTQAVAKWFLSVPNLIEVASGVKRMQNWRQFRYALLGIEFCS